MTSCSGRFLGIFIFPCGKPARFIIRRGKWRQADGACEAHLSQVVLRIAKSLPRGSAVPVEVTWKDGT